MSNIGALIGLQDAANQTFMNSVDRMAGAWNEYVQNRLFTAAGKDLLDRISSGQEITPVTLMEWSQKWGLDTKRRDQLFSMLKESEALQLAALQRRSYEQEMRLRESREKREQEKFGWEAEDRAWRNENERPLELQSKRAYINYMNNIGGAKSKDTRQKALDFAQSIMRGVDVDPETMSSIIRNAETYLETGYMEGDKVYLKDKQGNIVPGIIKNGMAVPLNAPQKNEGGAPASKPAPIPPVPQGRTERTPTQQVNWRNSPGGKFIGEVLDRMKIERAQKISTLIEQGRAEGLSDEQIKRKLAWGGFSREDIEMAFGMTKRRAR